MEEEEEEVGEEKADEGAGKEEVVEDEEEEGEEDRKSLATFPVSESSRNLSLLLRLLPLLPAFPSPSPPPPPLLLPPPTPLSLLSPFPIRLLLPLPLLLFSRLPTERVVNKDICFLPSFFSFSSRFSPFFLFSFFRKTNGQAEATLPPVEQPSRKIDADAEDF